MSWLIRRGKTAKERQMSTFLGTSLNLKKTFSNECKGTTQERNWNQGQCWSWERKIIFKILISFCQFSFSHRYLHRVILKRKISTVHGELFEGHEFYRRIEQFLRAHTASQLQCLQPKTLLEDYVARWKCYQDNSKVLDGLCSPLNRVVKNIEGFESINQLALVTWRESFFTHIEPKMTCAILNLIEGERAGQLIDSELVKAVIECYAELGKC